MTFLVVFFTILWFIRFVKQHFKSWENLGPIGSNSLSTGDFFIFLFMIVDRTLDFEIWLLPEAVFYPDAPFKTAAAKLATNSLGSTFSGFYPLDYKTY